MPLFVSHVRLQRFKTLPVAIDRWALDSGGFSQLSTHGRWQFTYKDYTRAVTRYRDEVGMLDWVAPMDWMCEPSVVAKTGFTVEQHQVKTVASFLFLRERLGDIVIPVIQGWERDDYMRCVDIYDANGVDLTKERTVGIGSICRRDATEEIVSIVQSISSLGISPHAFGVKGAAFARTKHLLGSADSLSWSYAARKRERLPGCTHKKCNNCLKFALKWRADFLRRFA